MRSARIKTLLVMAALAMLLLATGCRAEGTPEPSPNEPSSGALVESPKKYDGTVVTFTGEAIGEAMARGDYAWVHVNDDPYYVKNVEEGAQLGGYNSGMAVWTTRDQADKISQFGDYKHEGDIVKVTGVFNAACGQHGGDMDIHATTISVVTKGHGVVDVVHPGKALWALGLALLAFGMYLLNRLWNRTS